VPTKTHFRHGLSKNLVQGFATWRQRFATYIVFTLLQYLVFAYQVVVINCGDATVYMLNVSRC